MSRYIFDLETDALLDKVTRIHCLAVYDLDKQELLSFADQPGYRPISEGIALLSKATLLVGHNILTYDIPVLHKRVGFKHTALVRDTLVLSRLIYPEIKTQVDFGLIHRKKAQPGQWMGRHSLEAWGIRLGNHKDSFGKTTDWKEWSKEMHEYCCQDVMVNLALWKKFEAMNYSETAIQLEHEFRWVIHLQEQFGYPFDVEAAARLQVELLGRKLPLEHKLKQSFRPWFKPVKVFTPKRDNKTLGYRAGCPMTKIELVEFNPGSREQIAHVFKRKYGWQPNEFTETGHPTISESVLLAMPYEEAKWCNEYLVISKLLGMLAEGANAWLRLERDGRIHGQVITNGAVTGRCTHSKPNVAQVPKVKSGKRPDGTKGILLGFEGAYGFECRSLFHAPAGWVQVGADASGLELRCLAHYMARWDGGAYGKVILEGDIHTVNQEAAGLPSRDNAKTFIYAFLYGAGPIKIGSIVAPLASQSKQKSLGLGLIKTFMQRIPAIGKLKMGISKKLEDQKKAGKPMCLKGLDGRILHVRSAHSALNTLLQSAGAIAVKKATVILYQKLTDMGLVFGQDYAQVAHVHDEFQIICRPELAETIGNLAVQSIREAGEFFGFRMPLDGEFKIGKNWAETH